MSKLAILAAAGVAFSASVAAAADVGPMPYDWTGLYAGINGGYAFAGDDRIGIAGVHVGDLSLNGLFGGVQLGYNHQMESIVLGVETDMQLADIDDFHPDASDQIDWFGTTRLRLGVAADRALFYVTGGLAYGGGNYKELVTPVSKDYSRLGWAAGAGLEYAMTDHLSVKGEYLYANFGRFDVGQTIATPDFHSVRLGLNFKF